MPNDVPDESDNVSDESIIGKARHSLTNVNSENIQGTISRIPNRIRRKIRCYECN